MNYFGGSINDNLIYVELLSNLVSNMKNVKLLNLLSPNYWWSFVQIVQLVCRTSHVPQSFAASHTVPIPKYDGRPVHCLLMTSQEFLSVCHIEAFELTILDRFSVFFTTSDHQFGFKKNFSCRDAFYCVRNVVETFISNGSTVNVCALDLSKAFDRMNHYVLFLKLIDRNMPAPLLNIF